MNIKEVLASIVLYVRLGNGEVKAETFFFSSFITSSADAGLQGEELGQSFSSFFPALLLLFLSKAKVAPSL